MTIQAPFAAHDCIAQNAVQLAGLLATDVGDILQQAITERGVATLVVSGGSTPEPFLQALSRLPLLWQSVVVTLADERWVDRDHADSNAAFLFQHFFQGAAAQAKFIELKNSHATAVTGWDDCERNLATLPQPLDAVVLGMGSDAHTASLFPRSRGLQQALDMENKKLCWPMHPAEVSQPRMSLTLPVLLNTRNLFLHITGEKKREVLQRALAENDPLQYPVAALAAGGRDRLRVYWAQ